MSAGRCPLRSDVTRMSDASRCAWQDPIPLLASTVASRRRHPIYLDTSRGPVGPNQTNSQRVLPVPLIATCVAVGAVLALVLTVLIVMKPKRLKLSAGVWKLATLSFEADAGDKPEELPPGEGG